MSEEIKKRKCWDCRKEIEDKDNLFCEECDKKTEHPPGAGTYVIYDKL